MTISINNPGKDFQRGMNHNPSTWTTGTISGGSANATVQVGALTNNSVVRVFQTATSTSQVGNVIEAKYDANGDYQRTISENAGAVIISTCDGAAATADISFAVLVTEF
jgi:hypothetical protein